MMYSYFKHSETDYLDSLTNRVGLVASSSFPYSYYLVKIDYTIEYVSLH